MELKKHLILAILEGKTQLQSLGDREIESRDLLVMLDGSHSIFSMFLSNDLVLNALAVPRLL